jgi:hypothetical protein
VETPRVHHAARQRGCLAARGKAERASPVSRVKQIRLTERQIQSFIAAQKDMAAIGPFSKAFAGPPVRKVTTEIKEGA